MGKKWKIPTSGLQPGIERTGRKRDKNTTNTVGAIDERDTSSTQDDNLESTEAKDLTTSSRNTDAVMEEKYKENVPPLDESLSQNGGLAVENHTEVGLVRKKTKRRKRRKASRGGTSDYLPGNSNPSNLQAIETDEMDLKNETTSISNNPPSLVGEEDDASERTDSHPGEKNTANTVEAVDERNTSSTQDDNLESTEAKDLTTSHNTDAVMEEKSKEKVAPLDESPSQKGDLAVENHTEVGVVWTKTKRKKRRKASGDDTSNYLPNNSNPSNLQENIESVIETAEMDLKNETSSISYNPPSLVGEEDHPGENLNTAADMNLCFPEVKSTNSIQSRRSKQKKIKPIDISVEEDVPSLSVRKDNSEESINKVDDSLTNGVDIGSTKNSVGPTTRSSSHVLKTYTSKRNKRSISEGKNISFCSSVSFRENANKPSNQVTQSCTSIDSLKATDVGSVKKNDEGLSETVDADTKKKSAGPVLLAKEEGLSETVDADIGKKADRSADIDLISSEAKSANSLQRMNRRKKKNKNSGTSSVACSEIIEMASELTQVDDSGSIQAKMAKNMTGKCSNCRVCPSPIRGVIDDFVSTELQSKQNDQLDSSKEEDVGFSFQIPDKVLLDNSCGSQSGSGVGSDNVSPTTAIDNALDSMGTCSNSETIDCLEKKEVASSSICHSKEFVISLDVSRSEDTKLDAVLLERTSISCTKKKLLVLDLNGLLADIFVDFHNAHKAHKKVGGKAVFIRPFCDDFLKFCFDRFEIGVWSSRKKYNVDGVVNYLMGDAKDKLLFCWDQSRCTVTGFMTIENTHKPLVLKELKKLWNKEEPDLPWEKGEYSPSNTLLVDDSPYKALCNPPHTAIFPEPYNFNDKNDTSLGPGGDLRVYLEGVAMANDVQQYVQEHAFGQHAITATDPAWKFYLKIIDKMENASALT